MKKTKSTNGITLVALIITIVILLTLSVITISYLNDAQIISSAKDAAKQFGDKQNEESSILNKYLNILNPNNPDQPDLPDNPDDSTCKHTWKAEITKPASCTESGTKKYTCTSCGITTEEAIAALGHTKIEETKNATCTTSGKKTIKCSTCDEVILEEPITALGHNYTNKVSSIYKKSNATYTSPAIYYKSCSRCGTYGNGGTFTYGSPLTSGNTAGGDIWDEEEDEKTDCELYGHYIDYSSWPNDEYEQCEHTHVVIWKCKRSGCNFEVKEAIGHFANSLRDFGYNIFNQRAGEFTCICGYSADINSTEIMDYLQAFYSGKYSHFTYRAKGINMWNTIWKSRCNCQKQIQPSTDVNSYPY